MARVFISHSNQDKKGRAFFDGLFGSYNHKAFWYQWEGLKPPHGDTLKKEISISSSVFVILTKYMQKNYTISWVGYEVGIAAAMNKNIWVFEPAAEFVEVPVPYVTGYIQFPETIHKKNTYPYSNIVGTAGIQIPSPHYLENKPDISKYTCIHDDCKATYFKFTLTEKFYCPVCRRLDSEETFTPFVYFN